MSNCPECNSSETAVKDSRPSHHINTIVTRRRRICLSCSVRFTTFEVSEATLLTCGFAIDNPGVVERTRQLQRLMKQMGQNLEGVA